MVLLAIMIAFGMGLSMATWWGVVLAALFWVGAVAVLQRMGKADPLLRQVYLRHIRYEDWYPAKSGIYSASVQPPMKWKRRRRENEQAMVTPKNLTKEGRQKSCS